MQEHSLVIISVESISTSQILHVLNRLSEQASKCILVLICAGRLVGFNPRYFDLSDNLQLLALGLENTIWGVLVAKSWAFKIRKSENSRRSPVLQISGRTVV